MGANHKIIGNTELLLLEVNEIFYFNLIDDVIGIRL